MLDNVFDIYESAERFAQHLAQHGRPEPAEAIREAVAGGATGTEILMRLRWVLRRLSDSDLASAELACEIEELLSSIDAKLA